MKILVDELPKNPEECPFSEFCKKYIDGEWHYDNYCNFKISRGIVCKIGSEDFECPSFREFNARTEEPIPGHSNCIRIAPVKLIE